MDLARAPRRARSNARKKGSGYENAQQHMPITVGPFYLTHPVNFPCGRKNWSSRREPTTFGRAFLLFTWGLGPSRTEKVLIEIWACDLRGERQVR
jgi:hypothetical protein